MWNPRFVQYCRLTGNLPPDETLERDREEWSGGLMCGYIRWIGERWIEWRTANLQSDQILSEADHEKFDKWLEELKPK